MSPSPRRAWIEMSNVYENVVKMRSPSPRRAWIEITSSKKSSTISAVALPTEGVD